MLFRPFPCLMKTNIPLKFLFTRSCVLIQITVTVCMDEFPSISLVPHGDFGLEFVCWFEGGCTMMEKTLRPQEETVGALVPLEMRVTAGLCPTQLL